MKAQLKVNRIEWMNQDDELTVTLEEQNGLMSYDSKMYLPASALNALLSDLQKQSPEVDLQSCLTVEQWSEDEVNFVFDLSSIRRMNYFIEGVALGRQICA